MEQQLERKLQKSIQKEKAVNLNTEKNREAFRKQYEEMLGTTQKTADTFGLSYANAFKNTTIQSKQSLRLEMNKQKTITDDRKMIETHKGKESKQEAAAIQRGTYSNYSYDHGTASNVLTKYREKKQQRENGQPPAAYKCTGKEFLLPPAQNMNGAMADQIASVMMERDRIKTMTKGNTPLSKAAYAVNKEFLEVMNDLINTYFTANGVKQEGRGSVKEKDKKAAKQHMALALEKYELFARTKDQKIAAQLESSLKKTNAYKAKKRETENNLANDPALSFADKLQEMKQLIGSNPNLYSQNEKIIAQVMAEFEALRKRANQIYTNYTSSKAALDDNAISGGQNAEELEAVKNELLQQYTGEANMLKTGITACSSYMRFLFNNEAMPAMERTYIKARFGKSADIQGRSEGAPALKMNVPLGKQKAGISEYDEKMKADLEAYEKTAPEKVKADFEGKPYMYKFSTFKRHTMTEHNMEEFRRVTKFQNQLMEKYDITSRRGTRDMADLYTPMVKNEYVPVNDKEFEQYALDTHILIHGKNCVPGEKGEKAQHQDVSKEEVYEAFHRQLPKYREVYEEMTELRKLVPSLQEPGNLEHYKDNFSFFKVIQGKCEALGYMMETLTENKKLMSMITEEEKEELIKIRSEAAATDVTVGQWYAVYNKIAEFTPQQILDGEMENIFQGKTAWKLITFEEQLERFSRPSAIKKFQKAVDAARKE